jgi:hypothetical protein
VADTREVIGEREIKSAMAVLNSALWKKKKKNKKEKEEVEEEDSFQQQFELKFKKETAKLPHLEHRILWCRKLDTPGIR